ncbi:lipid storage droplet protein [Penaeus vannamei]|uniref:Lipid storage droplet protein n=1 Tax=Penaeus vannamei TaxID=6689 RepID=A0A423TJK5_PENVA|nr:lipid storage droplet protein [Penaeus vannamei]
MAPDCQDMGRDMTADHVTFGDGDNPAFLNRMLALPALNDACNLAFTAYATAKIVTTTRHLLLGALAGEPAAPPPTLTAALTTRATHTVDCVADTKGGRKAVDLAVCVADRLLDTGHALIDSYAPAEEGDLHETDERDGGLANKGTALANRVRRRLVRSANRMILNDLNADDMDVVSTVQRLVDLGRRSLLSWYLDVSSMSGGQLVKGSVSVTLSAGKAGLCTTQNLVVKGVGMTRAIVWGNVASIHGMVMGGAHSAVTRAVGGANNVQSLVVGGMNTTQSLVMTSVSITRRLVKGSVSATHHLAKGGVQTTHTLVKGTFDVSQSLVRGSVNTAQTLMKGGIYTAQKMVKGSVKTTQYVVVRGKDSAQSVVQGGVRLTQSLMVSGVGVTQKVIKRGLVTGQGVASEGWELAHRGLQASMGMVLATLSALSTLGTKSAGQMSAVVPASITNTAHALYGSLQSSLTPIHQALEYGRSAPGEMWSKVAELPESRIASRAQEWAADTLKAATTVIKQTAGGDVQKTIPASSSVPSQLSGPNGLVPHPDPLLECEKAFWNAIYITEPNHPVKLCKQEESQTLDFSLNSTGLLPASACASADRLPNPPALCTDLLSSLAPGLGLPQSPPMSPCEASADTALNAPTENESPRCPKYYLQPCADAVCDLHCGSPKGVDLVISLTSPVRRVDLEAICPVVMGTSESANEPVSPGDENDVSGASPASPTTVKVSMSSSSCVGITTSLTTPVRYVDMEAACCCTSGNAAEPYREVDISEVFSPDTREAEYVDVALKMENLIAGEWQGLRNLMGVSDSKKQNQCIPSKMTEKSCSPAALSGPQAFLYPDPCSASRIHARENEGKEYLLTNLVVAENFPVEARTNHFPSESLKDTPHAGARKDRPLEVFESLLPETARDIFQGNGFADSLPPTARESPFLTGTSVDTFPTVALTDSLPMVTLSDTPGSVSSGYGSEASYSPACWWARPPRWQDTNECAGAFGGDSGGDFMDPHERHHLLNTRRALGERLGDLGWSTTWSPAECPEVFNNRGSHNMRNSTAAEARATGHHLVVMLLGSSGNLANYDFALRLDSCENTHT